MFFCKNRKTLCNKNVTLFLTFSYFLWNLIKFCNYVHCLWIISIHIYTYICTYVCIITWPKLTNLRRKIEKKKNRKSDNNFTCKTNMRTNLKKHINTDEYRNVWLKTIQLCWFACLFSLPFCQCFLWPTTITAQVMCWPYLSRQSFIKTNLNLWICNWNSYKFWYFFHFFFSFSFLFCSLQTSSGFWSNRHSNG